MAGKEFKLKVEPEEGLEFSGPFSEEMVKELTLTNPTQTRFAYKVKCTDNAVFKIRPVMRILEAGGTEKISITRNLPDGKEPTRLQRIFVHHCDAEDPKTAKDAWGEKVNEVVQSLKTSHVDPSQASADPAAGQTPEETPAPAADPADPPPESAPEAAPEGA